MILEKTLEWFWDGFDWFSTASRFKNRDKDDTYVGTLSDLFQLSVTATGTRLRPIAGMILEHILSSKPLENRRF